MSGRRWVAIDDVFDELSEAETDRQYRNRSGQGEPRPAEPSRATSASGGAGARHALPLVRDPAHRRDGAR